MLRELLRRGRRRALFEPGPTTRRVEIGPEGIARLLPHRPPFALLDSIEAVDLAQRAIRGARRIDPRDPVLAGHFPGDPVVPGVLLLESVGQLGICLQHLLSARRTHVEPADRPQPLRLLRVLEASFVGPVLPGDELRLHCVALDDGDYVSRCVGQVLVGDRVKAVAGFEVAFLGEERAAPLPVGSPPLVSPPGGSRPSSGPEQPS